MARAYYWLTFNLVSAKIPRPCLQRSFLVGLPQQVLVPEVVPSQVQEFALSHIQLLDVLIGPFFQPLNVPLDGNTTLWCTSHSSHFCVMCKLAKGTICLLWFGCGRQQKRHMAAPPPARVRRRMERNRQKLVGRDKGSLTEQQTKGTVTATIQVRGIHKTKQNTESRSHHPPLRAPKPRVRSRRPAPPPREPSMMAHGMEYPALFGQVGSARPVVPLPGFRWKLTRSWPNPGHHPPLIPYHLCHAQVPHCPVDHHHFSCLQISFS